MKQVILILCFCLQNLVNKKIYYLLWIIKSGFNHGYCNINLWINLGFSIQRPWMHLVISFTLFCYKLLDGMHACNDYATILWNIHMQFAFHDSLAINGNSKTLFPDMSANSPIRTEFSSISLQLGSFKKCLTVYYSKTVQIWSSQQYGYRHTALLAL